MSRSQLVAENLPLLRRYARALTGNQSSGDAYVGAMLEALATACNGNTLISVATDLTLATEAIRTQTAAKWKSELGVGKTPDFHKKPTVFLLLAE
jgi:16S rRNA C1402 (ribose-2'-O) methylase RsmI